MTRTKSRAPERASKSSVFHCSPHKADHRVKPGQFVFTATRKPQPNIEHLDAATGHSLIPAEAARTRSCGSSTPRAATRKSPGFEWHMHNTQPSLVPLPSRLSVLPPDRYINLASSLSCVSKSTQGLRVSVKKCQQSKHWVLDLRVMHELCNYCFWRASRAPQTRLERELEPTSHPIKQHSMPPSAITSACRCSPPSWIAAQKTRSKNQTQVQGLRTKRAGSRRVELQLIRKASKASKRETIQTEEAMQSGSVRQDTTAKDYSTKTQHCRREDEPSLFSGSFPFTRITDHWL